MSGGQRQERYVLWWYRLVMASFYGFLILLLFTSKLPVTWWGTAPLTLFAVCIGCLHLRGATVELRDEELVIQDFGRAPVHGAGSVAPRSSAAARCIPFRGGFPASSWTTDQSFTPTRSVRYETERSSTESWTQFASDSRGRREPGDAMSQFFVALTGVGFVGVRGHRCDLRCVSRLATWSYVHGLVQCSGTLARRSDGRCVHDVGRHRRTSCDGVELTDALGG